MGQIYAYLMKAEKEKQGASNGESFSWIFGPKEVKTERDAVISFPQEKIDTLKHVKGSGKKEVLDEESAQTLSLFFVKLASSIKTDLDGIRTSADLSRRKFEDIEFENDFVRSEVC